MMTFLLGLMLAFAADGKIDNEFVRVVDAVDQPQHPSALHKHDVNRVMVYLTAGDLDVRYQDGRVDHQHWKAGQVAWSPAGGMHISENVGNTPLRIVEIELKTPGKPVVRKPDLDPVKIDPKHNTLLFENAQVRVFRSWRDAGDSEMMHEHAGAGKVGVYLSDLNATVKLADGTVNTLPKAVAGESAWGPPIVHATKNLGPNRMEMIVVEVK